MILCLTEEKKKKNNVILTHILENDTRNDHTQTLLTHLNNSRVHIFIDTYNYNCFFFLCIPKGFSHYNFIIQKTNFVYSFLSFLFSFHFFSFFHTFHILVFLLVEFVRLFVYGNLNPVS